MNPLNPYVCGQPPAIWRHLKFLVMSGLLTLPTDHHFIHITLFPKTRGLSVRMRGKSFQDRPQFEKPA